MTTIEDELAKARAELVVLAAQPHALAAEALIALQAADKLEE